MAEQEILDAAPYPDEPGAEPVPPAHDVHTALERRPPPSREVLMPLDVDQVVEGMHAYQEMLPKLLTDSDYQDAGWDKKLQRNRRFVKKSGWRKIARAFNLSTEIVSVRVERDAEGNPQRAEAIVRAIAPNGLVSDGDGYCDADESRFNRADGRQKLENDLRTTATTRAKNRAISDMVGMGDVSAEEAETAAAAAGHPWGEQADREKGEKAFRALTYLLDGPDQEGETRARKVWDAIVAESSPDPAQQFFPKAAVRVILLAALELKTAAESDWGEPVDPLPQATAALDDMVDEVVETVKGGTWQGKPVRGGEETSPEPDADAAAEASRIAEEAFSADVTIADEPTSEAESSETVGGTAVVSEGRRDRIVATIAAKQLTIGNIRALLKAVGENVPTSDLRTEEGINAVVGRLTIKQADDIDNLMEKM